MDAFVTTCVEIPEWRELYETLLAERVDRDGGSWPRWDWRKALYIAWSVVPKAKRKPATEEELAVILNLKNTRTIRTWKQKFPEIERRIAELPKQLLMRHLGDVYAALVAVAVMPIPGAHQDRKLFLELTGDYVQKGSVQHSTTDDGGFVIQVVQRED